MQLFCKKPIGFFAGEEQSGDMLSYGIGVTRSVPLERHCNL